MLLKINTDKFPVKRIRSKQCKNKFICNRF